MIQIKISTKKLVTRSAIVAMAVFMVVTTTAAPFSPVYADTYDDRINAVQAEIGGYQSQIASLRAQSDTLQNALNVLTAEKNTIQAQVNLSQAKYDKLVIEIEANEKKLADQQAALTVTIGDLASEADTSPIEVLAGSSTVGEYVSRQEYRSSIQDQVQSSITEITKIQEELAAQKTEIERVLADQTAQRDSLAQKESEQAGLLAQTQGQEASYQSIVATKNAEINQIRSAQAAAYAAYANSHSNVMYGSGTNGGYPDVWANAPQDSMADSWGMYNRECVSYVAWKVNSVGHYMPYWGNKVANATNWPNLARDAGIPVGGRPAAGNPVGVAVVWQAGQGMGSYGHVAYVDIVNGDGSLEVSQYNVIHGQFNRMHVSASDASWLTYIYF